MAQAIDGTIPIELYHHRPWRSFKLVALAFQIEHMTITLCRGDASTPAGAE